MIPASDGEYIKKLVTEPPEGEDPDPDVPPARDERWAVLDQLRFAPDDDSDAGR